MHFSISLSYNYLFLTSFLLLSVLFASACITLQCTPVAVAANYSGECACGEVQSLSLYLGVLVLAGIELTFFTAAPVVLCFGFVTKTVLTT